MPIKIYDSLSKKKVDFIPLEKGKVKMYSCGVTVYDDCHIGHARSLYIFDVITRYLKYRGYDVNFVRNITDIDDKIINKAKELNITAREIADKYIESYKRDLNSLGIEQTKPEPQATENIPEMIKHIEGLIEKGFAYEADADVYFAVRKFKDYGKLSGQSIEQMLEAVRIEKDHKKTDPLDFALWKKSESDEPSWDSPWGKGRPGWHIECSVMSAKFLKTETLDIHAGGRDLIFPHHENEIAQSEVLTAKPFAKYWLHHGLLTINGQKMSKSLGNFITIQDALKKFSADDLKLFFLSSHYASPLDFNDKQIEDAKKKLENIRIFLRKVQRIIKNPPAGINSSAEKVDFVEKSKAGFFEAMDDDFNTPRAISYIFNLLHDANKFIDSEEKNERYAEIVYIAEDAILKLCKEIFGLALAFEKPLTAEEKNLIAERQKSRINNDFKRSDELRQELKKKGIIVEDTKEGQVWRR